MIGRINCINRENMKNFSKFVEIKMKKNYNGKELTMSEKISKWH